MSDDQQSQKRSLSEISHLFLSSVRDRQTGGAPRPQRIPPGGQRKPDGLGAGDAAARHDISIDMTPEEFAQAFGTSNPVAGGGDASLPGAMRRQVQVSAVLGAHLNGRQFDRVKEYARHLAMIHGRIGLIELDASEFRLMSFDVASPVLDPDLDARETHECYDMREMADALEEMNCDVDRWLLLVPNPRTPEARALLRCVHHWVLLTTCDHDGVVSSYRMLKGLAESYRPRLSLAILDGTDAAETGRVYKKLQSVCQQFLGWELADEPTVRKTQRVSETLVLCCRPTRDKGQMGNAPQWDIVGGFLQSAAAALPAPEDPGMEQQIEKIEDAALSEIAPATTDERRLVADVVVPTPAIPAPAAPTQSLDDTRPATSAIAPQPVTAPAFAPIALPAAPARDTAVDVLDLPGGAEANAEAILTAILRQTSAELVECPVRAPMCSEARLAVTRDRDVVLLAVAREGLKELRSIGQAYRWLIENRALIGMAVPQFALDATRAPRLRLLVDRADVSADVLQPMLQSEHVSVQAYQKLRWGGRTGLFLEAA